MLQCSIYPASAEALEDTASSARDTVIAPPQKKAKKLKRRNDAMSQFSVCRLGTFIRKEEML